MAQVVRSMIVGMTTGALLVGSLGLAAAAPPVPSRPLEPGASMLPLISVQQQQYRRRPPPPAAPRRSNGVDPGAVIAGAALLGILGIAAASANNNHRPSGGYYQSAPPPAYGAYGGGYGYGGPAYQQDLGANDRYTMRAAAEQCKAGSKRHYRRTYGAESQNEQIQRAIYAGGGTWEMHGTAYVTGPYGAQTVGFVCTTRGTRVVDFQ